MVNSNLIGGSSSGRTQAFGAWYEGSNPSPPAISAGIDIGGSKIRAVLWSGKKVIKTKEVKTPKNLVAFKIVLKKLLGNSVAKLGIAVPGRISESTFVSATNLPYIQNFNFAKFFAGAKVKIDHDARCFARAEYVSKRTTLFLMLGTGVGRAVGRNGKILRVKKLEYPERWEREYKKIRDSKNDQRLAAFLGLKLKKIISFYKPKTIAVGGGVATRKGFLKKLQKALRLPVKKSKFGKNSVAIGAAIK